MCAILTLCLPITDREVGVAKVRQTQISNDKITLHKTPLLLVSMGLLTQSRKKDRKPIQIYCDIKSHIKNFICLKSNPLPNFNSAWKPEDSVKKYTCYMLILKLMYILEMLCMHSTRTASMFNIFNTDKHCCVFT